MYMEDNKQFAKKKKKKKKKMKKNWRQIKAMKIYI